MQHVTWANEITRVDGKLKEHVSFKSFVRRFGFSNREEAMSQYGRLLGSSRLSKTRRDRLRAVYEDFVKARLDSFWVALDKEQLNREFDASCEAVVKRTAILFHQASLAISAQGISAVQANKTRADDGRIIFFILGKFA